MKNKKNYMMFIISVAFLLIMSLCGCINQETEQSENDSINLETPGNTNVSVAHTNHNYVSVVTPPTSTEQGYTTHICDVCGDSYTDSYVAPVRYSEGLEYEVNDDGATCRITGWGPYPENDINIPPEIDGYKVTAIGDSAFSGCSVTSIIIPDSVTTVGTGAFFGCWALNRVSFGSGLLTIGSEAFWNCDSLTNIAIPESVNNIGELAFSECDNLKFNIYDNAYYLGNNTNPYVALIRRNETTVTSCEVHTDTTVIADKAFYYCQNLANINIGDGVKTIGREAFCATDLTSVVIPDSVAAIGDGAFSWCAKLTTITLSEGLISIGDKAFYECWELTCVTIPDSVTEIGNYAFSDCQALTSVTIGNSVTELKRCVFSDCKKLIAITIPDSVITIESSAFHSCKNLTNVIIGKNVTTIGVTAFYECKSLVNITIPASMTTIEKKAFTGCWALESIIFEDASGWYVTKAEGASSGINLTIPDAETAESYLTLRYDDYYWYKK